MKWHLGLTNRLTKEISRLKVNCLDDLKDGQDLYTAKKKWKIQFWQLILKPTMKHYFKHFFDPRKELLGLAIFWDTKGNLTTSAVMPIYISQKNTRKMYGALEIQTSKPVVGSLVIQFFIWDCSIENHQAAHQIAVLSAQLHAFTPSRTINFSKQADGLAAYLLTKTKAQQLNGYELFRGNYPSSSLVHQKTLTITIDTLFYNTIINIELWKI
ncbi:hypothetical protein [Aureispira anguillae]|uniref:Uncharacterized protein n=1 Tax=Aureispira anguillae TaxID=2864201 RepID=A0A915YGA1_9BACT|nr:hypothetical protein [Aureispira anguillae]BDS12451.1 hypothetical protein AsAng_0031740 [Aureispira anguillae]